MKKIGFLATIIFAIALTPVFANDWPGINNRIAASFIKEFRGATDVHWSRAGEFQQVRFVFLEHSFLAYFTDEGELLGTARDILFNALPLPVMKSFEQRFANAGEVIIHEIVNGEGVFYLFALDMGNRHYRVKLDSYGNFLNIERKKGVNGFSSADHVD